jgi:hypothetical protein
VARGWWCPRGWYQRRPGPRPSRRNRRFLVAGDDDGAVATRPQPLSPEVEAARFFGDVGIHKLHEAFQPNSWPALVGDSRNWLCVLKNTKAWMVMLQRACALPMMPRMMSVSSGVGLSRNFLERSAW